MQQACTICGTPYAFEQQHLDFFKQIGVPTPNCCPTCMARWRLSFRCENDLYKRTCAKTGKPIITYHPPNAPYPVYTSDIWWGDSWDPMDYGQNYDPSRGFFEQFIHLHNRVPKANIYMVASENCDYTNYATHNKNCYLIFGSWFSEDCLYGNTFCDSTSCIDCHFVFNCQFCYECVDCTECYEVLFARNCSNCTNCRYLYDCRQCEHCIGCWNLRRKKYCVLNEEVGAERYEALLEELRHDPVKAKKNAETFQKNILEHAIHKYVTGENNDQCSGDYNYNSKNVTDSYIIRDGEDAFFCDRSTNQKTQSHCSGMNKGERAFNSVSVDFSHTVVCCMNGEHHMKTAYCIDCYNVSNCIGCVGLRQKEYCIFNKQYTKEEYETLSESIRTKALADGEWGKFFPLSMNPFFFNKTTGFDYFPLSKEEALQCGFRWKDHEEETTDVAKIIPASKLPLRIDDIPNDVLNWAIRCERTDRPYRIMPLELTFYRKNSLPLPHLHPDERSRNRLAQRNPRKLWKRECMKCGEEMETTYSPERSEIVYCEECYLKEVY